jgi:hypothetical protein
VVPVGDPVTEPLDYSQLRAHVREHHPAVKSLPRANADLGRVHAQQHHKYRGSLDHHHGADPGPHARPESWYTGQGAVMTGGAGLHDHRPDGSGEQFGMVTGLWWARCAVCGQQIHRRGRPGSAWFAAS